MVQLKANQPSLDERLTSTYPSQPPQEQSHTLEIGRQSRFARRTTRLWPLPAEAGADPWHDHFCALIEVQRRTEGFDTRQKNWIERQEIAYSRSTVRLSTADCAQAMRRHGGMENRLPYVRDVHLGEDASRIRRNPGLFALLRRFALNGLRFNDVTNISLAL